MQAAAGMGYSCLPGKTCKLGHMRDVPTFNVKQGFNPDAVDAVGATRAILGAVPVGRCTSQCDNQPSTPCRAPGALSKDHDRSMNAFRVANAAWRVAEAWDWAA
jgi:hypothetical protein